MTTFNTTDRNNWMVEHSREAAIIKAYKLEVFQVPDRYWGEWFLSFGEQEIHCKSEAHACQLQITIARAIREAEVD